MKIGPITRAHTHRTLHTLFDFHRAGNKSTFQQVAAIAYEMSKIENSNPNVAGGERSIATHLHKCVRIQLAIYRIYRSRIPFASAVQYFINSEIEWLFNQLNHLFIVTQFIDDLVLLKWHSHHWDVRTVFGVRSEPLYMWCHDATERCYWVR